MRSAIEEQIEEYKKGRELKCGKCGSKSKPEVDHMNILFVELYENFLKGRKDIPKEFDNTKSNSKCFREEDKKFKEEWEEYHKENAILRILCNICNNKYENKQRQNDKILNNNEKEEAYEYMKEYVEEKSDNEKEVIENIIVKNEYNYDKCINVYTDGSCINNGSDNAIGGYGVFFGKDNANNISKRIRKNDDYKITNNRAELKAILEAIKKLKKEIEERREIMIHTDSQYSIQVLTSSKTYKKIIKNKEVPNGDYVKKGYEYIKDYPNIKFHHIYSHTGKTDEHSIGNENADILANEAIKDEIGKIKFTFGKYKGEIFEEIYKKDEKYFIWCTENSKNQKHDTELFLNILANKNIQIKNKTNNENNIDELEKELEMLIK